MRKRLVILSSIGLLLIAITYVALPTVLERVMMPKPARHYVVHDVSPKREGLADVQIWAEMPPGEQSYWRAKNAVRLIVLGGEAFFEERRLARGDIRGFLDSHVVHEKAEYVILFPAKGSKWGEIFPIVDECRKSRVRIVLINVREA